MNDFSDEESEAESSSTWILLQIADSGKYLRLTSAVCMYPTAGETL